MRLRLAVTVAVLALGFSQAQAQTFSNSVGLLSQDRNTGNTCVVGTSNSCPLPTADSQGTAANGLANVANSAANATIAAAVGKTSYVEGFQITGLGATAATTVVVTMSGLAGGSQQWSLNIPAGATTPITPLIVAFYPPLPASGLNTAIALAVPAAGAGNTSVIVSMQGFQR